MLTKHTLWLLGLLAALVIPSLLPQPAHGMYDPKHGRWLQRDPAGVRVDGPKGSLQALDQYQDSPLLYEYVRTKPASVVDPHGLMNYKLTYKEHLNEEELDVDTDWKKKLERGHVDHYLEAPPGKCVPYHGRIGRFGVTLEGYQLQFEAISLEVNVYVLKRGHEQFGRRDDFYDDKWGKERSNDRERDAVIEHERDHARSWTEGGWPQLTSELDKLDGTLFCSEQTCKKARTCALLKVQRFLYGDLEVPRAVWLTDWTNVSAHCESFDFEGRHGGGVYDQFPFDGVLDLRECLDCHTTPWDWDPLCGLNPRRQSWW